MPFMKTRTVTPAFWIQENLDINATKERPTQVLPSAIELKRMVQDSTHSGGSMPYVAISFNR